MMRMGYHFFLMGAFRRWSTLIMAAILLVGGWWAVLMSEQTADARDRDRLLRQAAFIAGTINTERVQALSFMADDKSNPSFQRLRGQMAAYAEALHLRCLYTVAIRNGRLVFGPESLAEKDPIASPPGKAYEQPPAALVNVFRTRRMQTVGPYSDEYGTFVSAYAPVLDPQTGSVMLVIGIDVEAQAWQAAVARSRFIPMLLTLILLLILVTGGVLLEWRNRLPKDCPWQLRHTEVWLTAVAGMVITLGVAHMVHDDEDFSRQTRFSQLAQTQVERVIRAVSDLRDHQLDGLGRFFDAAKEEVTQQEFRDYTLALVRSGVAQAWEWIPEVSAKAREAFEKAAQRDGLLGYMIFQKDILGQRRPAVERDSYYPVYHVAPVAGNERVHGHDLGSEPVRRAALEEAMLTGMTTATDPITLLVGNGVQKGTLILRPVFVGGEPKTIFKGFAGVELSFEALLAHARERSGQEDAVVTLDLFQVSAGQPPQLIASTASNEVRDHAAQLALQRTGFSVVAPLFVFGKAYAVVVHPGPAFLTANPSRAGLVTVIAGLVLTAVLTLLVGLLTKRHAGLKGQVRESERRYRELFEGSRDGIVLAEVNGRIRDANSAYCRMLGHSLEELKAKDGLYKLTPERWWVWEQEEVLQHNLLRDGYSGVYEKEYIRSSGEIFPVEVQAYTIPSGEGTPQLLWCVVRDITERKRALNELSETNKRLNDMIDFLPDATLMIDHQGRVIAWNKAVEEMTGVAKQEMIGKGEHEYALPFYGERRPILIDLALIPEEELEKKYRQVVRKGDFLWGDTFVPQLYGGRGAHLSGTAAKLYDSSGRIVGAIESIRDVTERKQAVDALVESNRQLEVAIARANEMAVVAEQANTAKSEFLANMSHEIRTPLNGVIGMIELLLDTTLTEEQLQFATLVRTSGEALLAVINDILDFSKIEARKLDLEILDFDIRLTLEDAAELLTVKAQEKGLELVCLIDPDVPSLLRGDPGRLRQIVVNLVGNAVKFTRRGWVTIRAELEGEDEHSASLRFSVSDTGIGIPAERIESIFSAFTQVDGSTTRKYGGSGLGLTISKQLVELMGGRIGVESEEGKGSIFWFAAEFEKQPQAAQRPLTALADLQGARILVVDDHATNRLLVTTLLHTWGCRFSEAADGENALVILRTAAREGDPYRAVLLDMQMPEMNGEELGQRIKADPDITGTVLVMMTSLGQRGDAKRLESLGFAAYLTKPIRQAQLHDCLALVLGREKREEGAGPAALITRHTVSEASKRRSRILLAEDDKANQQVALAIIRKLGYQVDVAANGKEALEAVQAIAYDIILMDCHMPEMDGFEAARRIRNPESGVRSPTVPIIAMTARAMKGDREACLEAGMSDYVSKPVTPQILAEVLEKWLSRGTDNSAARSFPASPASALPATAISEEQAMPVLDRNGVSERLMGDEQLIGAVMEGFLDYMPGELKELRDLVADGKAGPAAGQAHKIKGAAATVGGEALREVAYAMEQAGRSGDVKNLQRLMPEMDRQFQRLKTAIKG